MTRTSRPSIAAVFGPLAAAGLLTLATPAFAQSGGQWVFRAGAAHVAPDVTSSALSAPSVADTRVDVDNGATVIFGATYYLDDDLSVDLLAGLPFKHDLLGAGSAAGVGKVGSVRASAPAVFLQYRFNDPSATVRPFVGAGVTYADFTDEKGTAALTAITNPGGPGTLIEADGAFGGGLQVGVSVRLARRWFLEGSITKLLLKTSATLSTAQKVDLTLDPLVTTIAVGYRF